MDRSYLVTVATLMGTTSITTPLYAVLGGIAGGAIGVGIGAVSVGVGIGFFSFLNKKFILHKNINFYIGEFLEGTIVPGHIGAGIGGLTGVVIGTIEGAAYATNHYRAALGFFAAGVSTGITLFGQNKINQNRKKVAEANGIFSEKNSTIATLDRIKKFCA